jgi:hypothetical protein
MQECEEQNVMLPSSKEPLRYNLACLLFIHDLFCSSEKSRLIQTKKLSFLRRHLAGTSLALCCEHTKEERR